MIDVLWDVVAGLAFGVVFSALLVALLMAICGRRRVIYSIMGCSKGTP